MTFASLQILPIQISEMIIYVDNVLYYIIYVLWSSLRHYSSKPPCWKCTPSKLGFVERLQVGGTG